MNRFFLFIFSFLFINLSYSQLDTLKLLSTVYQKQLLIQNGFIEYIRNDYLYSNITIKKKIWFVKDKNQFKLRSENYSIKDNQLESIFILNEKQSYYINPSQKRCDLYSFNLLKNNEIENYYKQVELENLPTFMINEGNIIEITNDLMKEIKKKENIFFETVNDLTINGISCFGYKIIDLDKNNGYIADKTGKGNEKFADKSEEFTYLSKSDTTIILKITKYFYKNPDSEKSTLESVINFKFNDKKNTGILIYNINTDTVKNYLKTNTKFNGNGLITEIADFSIKKLPVFKGIDSNNKLFNSEILNTKFTLIGFWTSDCEECLMQMDAINEQYHEMNKISFTFLAINALEVFDNDFKFFINEKKYTFPLIFSESAGKQLMYNTYPYYILIDEKQTIKEIFYELNQEIVEKIIKKLK